MDFIFLRVNRRCSFRVSRKPVILGYTGPLITKFDFIEIKTQFLRHLLGITKLDKGKNQCIRQKTGAQNIVKEIKQYLKGGYNMYRG